MDLYLALERLSLPLAGASAWGEEMLTLHYDPYFTSEFLPASRIYHHGFCLMPQSKISLKELNIPKEGNSFLVHFTDEPLPPGFSAHASVEIWKKNLVPTQSTFSTRRAESVPDIELYDQLNQSDRIYPYYPFDPNMEWHIVYNGENSPVGKFRLTRASTATLLLSRPYLTKEFEGSFSELIAAAENKLASRGEKTIIVPINNPMISRFFQSMGYVKCETAKVAVSQ